MPSIATTPKPHCVASGALCALFLAAAQCGGVVSGPVPGPEGAAGCAMPCGHACCASGPTIAVNGNHSCAITSAGTVMCWGAIYYGEFGGDAGLMGGTLVPVQVDGLSGVTALAAGTYHTCAMTSEGAVKCWGDNGADQLGDGSTTRSDVPVQVVGLSSPVTAIAAGWAHTCAVTSTGGVTCWGNNDAGQLGDGSKSAASPPVAVRGLPTGVRAIAAGQSHTCALTDVGAVACWGSNGLGQLGNGSSVDSSAPVPVQGLASGVVFIAAGANYACAVTGAGAVKCWGGMAAPQAVPMDISGLPSGITVLAAGNSHTCGLTAGGATVCWGQNDSLQLGDGSSVASASPVQVVGLSAGVFAIAAGSNGDHTCALTGTGNLSCWGSNFAGQLGDDSTTSSSVPVSVVGF